jgi:hypothetical protein
MSLSSFFLSSSCFHWHCCQHWSRPWSLPHASLLLLRRPWSPPSCRQLSRYYQQQLAGSGPLSSLSNPSSSTTKPSIASSNIRNRAISSATFSSSLLSAAGSSPSPPLPLLSRHLLPQSVLVPIEIPIASSDQITQTIVQKASVQVPANPSGCAAAADAAG